MTRLDHAIMIVPATIALLTVSACGTNETGTPAAGEPTTTTVSPPIRNDVLGLDMAEVVDNECLLTADEISALAGASFGDGAKAAVESLGYSPTYRCEYVRTVEDRQSDTASIDITRFQQGSTADTVISLYSDAAGSREIPGVARFMRAWESGDLSSGAMIFTDTLVVSVNLRPTPDDQAAPLPAPTDEQWKVAAQQLITRLPS